MVRKLPHMKYKRIEPLVQIEINDTYILGVYSGALSDFDLVLRYRRKDSSSKSGWSRIRTPKHIHWAVDVIIKMHHNAVETKKFIKFLIDLWDDHIKPLSSDTERNIFLDVNLLKHEANLEAAKYPGLARKGEYSVKFLYLIAKLLMVQEKTNLTSAYMFRQLLKALEDHKDIYKVVSIATQKR